jgi:hypothetical protein
MLSIGAPTRRRLGTLLERQRRRLRRQKAYSFDRLRCNAARPGWNNLHRVPRLSRYRAVVVGLHRKPRSTLAKDVFVSVSVRGAQSLEPKSFTRFSASAGQFRTAPAPFLPGIRHHLRDLQVIVGKLSPVIPEDSFNDQAN